MTHRTPVAAAAAQAAPAACFSVLGPGHVWALGVGIVLVGEYMGWNFSVGKGGMIAGLVACWVAGLLYTCVAMIDSEVTSTVAAAGGQYAQAKHIVGPLMAFNVGLFLVLAYTMLEAANAITIGFLLDTVRQHARPCRAQPEALHHPDHHVPGLAELSRRAGDADLQLRHHRDRLPRRSSSCSSPSSPAPRRSRSTSSPICRRAAALWLGRHPRGAAFRPVVLSRHRGHHAGGRGGALAGPLAPATAPWPASSRC